MERMPIPGELSFEALFLPNRDHGYLRGAAEHPLEDTAAFRAANAWWLAELSLLSYVPEEAFVREVLARAGLAEVVVLERESTHCILAGDLVVFRGTDDARDVLLDLDARLVEEGAGRVHRGFRAALDLLWDDVAARIGSRPVTFTGHSLGATLATLAASRHPPTRAAYTFGSPRVGDAAFGASIAAPVYRIVNNNDIVTRLPPPVRYRHVGSLGYLDNRGELHRDPALWDRVKEQISGHGARTRDNLRRWRAGDFGGIPYDSLVDHSPLHYAIHLGNHLASLPG